MSYDPKRHDYEYNENLTADENRENMTARYNYLYQWAKENWSYSCHAAGCEARAQYLESCSYNDDDQLDVNENDGWSWVEAQLEDYAMTDILDDMVKNNSIYWPENKAGYGGNGYGWMLDAVGYDIPGSMDYIHTWLENNEWYHNTDALKKVITKDYYDMWNEEA